MHGTNNKYKLLIHFSNEQLACCPFATIYYSKGFLLSKLTLIYFKLPTKLIQKFQTQKFYPKIKKKQKKKNKSCLGCSCHSECLEELNWNQETYAACNKPTNLMTSPSPSAAKKKICWAVHLKNPTTFPDKLSLEIPSHFVPEPSQALL